MIPHTAMAGRGRSVPAGSVPGAALLLVALSLPAARGEEEEATPPRIAADQAVFDWGRVFQGEEVAHTFTLTNTGGSPVLIRKIKPECGCTLARGEVEGKTLGPGESVQVTLNVSTAELEGGQVRKAAEIVSDFHAGDTKLWMQGIVTELFARSPEKPALEVVRDEEAAARAALTLTLRSNLPSPVRLEEARAEKDLVRVELEELEAGKRFALLVRPQTALDSEIPPDDKERILVKAQVGGKEVDLAFPVTLQVKQRIDVIPFRSFYFGPQETRALLTEGAPLPSKAVEVKSLGGPSHRFRITGLQVETGALRARLDTLHEGRSYRVTVELLRPDPKVKTRILRDKVILKTDDERVPEITIPALARL